MLFHLSSLKAVSRVGTNKKRTATLWTLMNEKLNSEHVARPRAYYFVFLTSIVTSAERA